MSRLRLEALPRNDNAALRGSISQSYAALSSSFSG